jgi:hypothetical protein
MCAWERGFVCVVGGLDGKGCCCVGVEVVVVLCSCRRGREVGRLTTDEVSRLSSGAGGRR